MGHFYFSLGVINGVQSSLNNSFDLLKCVLVITFPTPELFGLLVILSFMSISSGYDFESLERNSIFGLIIHHSRVL